MTVSCSHGAQHVWIVELLRCVWQTCTQRWHKIWQVLAKLLRGWHDMIAEKLTTNKSHSGDW